MSATGGAQFASIQAAVQAAVDGDIIEVQATGAYSMTFLLTKGVTITAVGPGRVQVAGTLTIRNLAAGRTVLLRSFAPQSASAQFAIDCDGLAGNVVGEDLVLSAIGPGLRANNCALVTLHDGSSAGRPAVQVIRSSFSTCGTVLTGSQGSIFNGAAGFGIEASQAARIGLSSCTVVGGDEGSLPGTSPGITLGAGCVLRAAGSSVRGGASGFHGSVSHDLSASIDPTAQLEVDDAAALPDGTIGPAPIVVPLCQLTGNGGAPGSTASVVATGPASGIVGLFVSTPIAATASVFGDVWGEPTGNQLLLFGPLPTLSWSMAIPLGFPRGLAFTFQAGCLVPGAATLSPPLSTMVP